MSAECSLLMADGVAAACEQGRGEASRPMLQTPLGAALQAVDHCDTRSLLAWMRTMGPQDRDIVLKHSVVTALDRANSLAPLLAMTMLMSRRADLHTGLGFAHLVRDNPAAAERSFRRALAVAPASASAILGCGVALRSLGRVEAADFLLRALEQTDDSAVARAAADALRDLLENPGPSVRTETGLADGEPIPHEAGSVANVFIY